ncbi:TolC family protein [Myroides sp. LJL115]
MLRQLLFLGCGLFCLTTFAKGTPKHLSKQQIEAMFMEQNIDLLAQRLEISQAQAQVIQSKLWPNPTFEISEVNLWKTTDIETQPIIWGNWGQAQQISMHLEQQIQTAGKRRKNIELQRLTVEQKEQEFSAILAQSKLDLRTLLTELQSTQEQIKLYQGQIQYTKALLQGFKKQFDLGNISQVDYIRLQAAQLQFQKQYTELCSDEQESLKELKNFLNIGQDIHLYITDALELPTFQVTEIFLEDWIIKAQENRADVQIQKNQELQSLKQLEIFKAQNTPDITLGIDYDRGGNIMRNFVGFGVSFDLPVFDRNKGNIAEAKLEIQKSTLQKQQVQNSIANDIVQAYKNYTKSLELLLEMDKDYEPELDRLMRVYQENFKNKNVSLIQYLDFIEAYLDNKSLILDTKKQIVDQFETLQYSIGTEL